MRRDQAGRGGGRVGGGARMEDVDRQRRLPLGHGGGRGVWRERAADHPARDRGGEQAEAEHAMPPPLRRAGEQAARTPGPGGVHTTRARAPGPGSVQTAAPRTKTPTPVPGRGHTIPPSRGRGGKAEHPVLPELVLAGRTHHAARGGGGGVQTERTDPPARRGGAIQTARAYAPVGGGGRGARLKGVRAEEGRGRPPSSSSSAPSVDIVNPVAQAFMRFFAEFKEDPRDTMPFYEAQLMAMAATGNPKIRLDFQHLKQYDLLPAHDLELADLAADDLRRSQNLIVEGFTLFMDHTKWDCSNIRVKEITLSIYNAELEWDKSLLDYWAESGGPSKLFELHDKLKVPVTQTCGNLAFEGYVNHILLAHEKGLSWEGKFEICHFRVRKWRFGLEFYISLPPMAEYSPGNMRKDLGTLSDTLIPEFSLDGGVTNLPSFFSQLRDSLKNIPKSVGHVTGRRSNHTVRYRRYLRKHVAFIPPLSRTNLIFGLIRAYDAMPWHQKSAFRRTVNRDVDTKKQMAAWFEFIRADNDLSLIYTGRPGWNGEDEPFEEGGMGLLTFQRHFFAHIGRHLKYPNGNVKIKTLKEPDYFISFHFKFLADVVKILMLTFNMSGLLEDVWLECTGESRQ